MASARLRPVAANDDVAVLGVGFDLPGALDGVGGCPRQDT
jgi:hypothetical protein